MATDDWRVWNGFCWDQNSLAWQQWQGTSDYQHYTKQIFLILYIYGKSMSYQWPVALSNSPVTAATHFNCCVSLLAG